MHPGKARDVPGDAEESLLGKVGRVSAEAQAHAERATAEGQAAANTARADSLRAGNQELIAASRIIEQLPALVEAASRSIAGSNLTILNGAQGVNEVLAGMIGQGLSILDVLRKSTAAAAVDRAVDGTAPAGEVITPELNGGDQDAADRLRR